MKKLMNKKIFLTILLSVIVSACATISRDVSPPQSFRPKNSENLWRITGSLDNEFKQGVVSAHVKRILHVHINGEEVITGQLSARATGELTGSYQNHPIIATCSSEQKTANWIDVRCMILIDNERAATLTF